MGKPTGSLEFARRESFCQPPLERIRHFDEFHLPLPEEERRRQGGRCMDCGVPFCQWGAELAGMTAGCPLQNLIPEWNDLVYRGAADLALERLLATNDFPEFTGRVCPALCEAACTCGLSGDPVASRENELAVIEDAFCRGALSPRPPKDRTGRRVAVVGSGPSGLALANRLNRRGHLVTVYESSPRPGGLLMYGIPNMKLEKRIVERRLALMEAEGVRFVTGTRIGGEFPVGKLREEYDAVCLCTGAGEPRDLAVPGREARGVSFAVDYLTRSTRALLEGRPNDEARGKEVLVVGGGDTGNDCVATAIRQGCRRVCQLELLPCPPEKRDPSNPWPQWPRVKKTDYGQAEAAAVFGSDPRRFETTVKELLSDREGNLRAAVTVRVSAQKDPKTGLGVFVPVAGTEEELPCRLLLIAAGFLGPRRELFRELGLPLPAKTDPYAAPIPGVFVAGDARRGQSLVVWAIREGRECALAVDRYLAGR